MSSNGGRSGNSDPGSIIAGSSGIQALEAPELLEFFIKHEGIIGALALYGTPDTSDQKKISKWSDRLQHPIPSDDPEVSEVINVLSNNAGFYDLETEDAIDVDPIAKQLKTTKDDVPADARTWRLRRSLVAIARLSKLVDCSNALTR